MEMDDVNANTKYPGVYHKVQQIAADAVLVNKQSIGGAIALLLVAWPTLAQAGLTISDRRYWPSEVRGGYVIPMPGAVGEPKVMPFQVPVRPRKELRRRRH